MHLQKDKEVLLFQEINEEELLGLFTWAVDLLYSRLNQPQVMLTKVGRWLTVCHVIKREHQASSKLALLPSLHYSNVCAHRNLLCHLIV